MADPRTFTLIGEFQDGITPELQKINNQLAALRRNFSNVGGKGTRTASRDMGRFAVASKELVESLKEQNQALRSVVEPLRQYRSEVEKTVAAMRKLQTVKGGAKGIEETNRALEEQIRLLQRLRAEDNRRTGFTGGGRRPPMPPGGGGGMGGGGGRTPAGRPMPRGGGYGGGRGVSGGDYSMATFAFAFSLGQGISQPITNAIVAGFQIGVGLMTKPFQYFAQNLQERMQDEMSDLKAAGGFFSLAREQKGEKLVNSFDQAVDFTQANNKLLDRIAASLPGSTQDYIEVSKRISDSIARTVVRDTAGSVKLAEQIRKEDQKTYGYEAITGTGTGAQRKAVQVLLADLTKQTVLAGQGGRAGAGGQMGAYGLPQLTERMLGQSEVSMGQFQRYSAIFSDPMVMDALAKEIPNINKTAANSAERIIAIRKMYERVLPPELIERYRRTLAGVTETFNTAIFGKESGIFGLGRKMQGMGKKINEFGQYIDWYGNVTTDVTKAMNADLSIYDLFRDVVVNIGQVIAPIVENLSKIWDPLRQLGLDLGQARDFTAKLLQSFNYYKKGFTEFIKDFSPEELKQLGKTGGVELRATLATIGNLFRQFGIISKTDFGDLIEDLKDPKAKVGPILQGMVEKFFESDIAERIGEFIGTLVGTVFSEVAKVTGFLADKVGGNKLTSGFTKGFEAAGGPAALSAIFEDVFKLMFRALEFVLTALPWQAKALIAAAVVLPAAISGIGMLIAEGIAGALSRAVSGKAIEGHMGKAVQYIRSSILNFINSLRNVFSKNLRVVPAIVRDVTNEPKALPPGKTPGALPTAAIVPKVAKGMNAFTAFFGRIGPFLKGVGPRFLSFFKGFGGILTVVGGALTALIALFKGESLAQALAKGAGPVLGAALGAALIPFLGPIGPMIGALIGGAIGTSASVTEPLAQAFGDLGDSVRIVTNLFLQLGGDLQGLARGIPGVAKDFDLLRWTLSLLLSPITLLKIALLGIYEAYLNIKEKIPGGGLTPEEKADRDAAAAERRRAFAEYQNRMDPRSLSDQIKGVREDIAKTLKAPFGDQKKFETSVKGGKLPQSEKYFALQNRLKLLYEQEKATRREVGAKSVLGGKNVTWNGKQWVEASKTPTAPKPPAPKLPTAPKPPAPKLPTVPKTAAVAAPKAVQQTAANTTQLNQKAAQQVSAINATKNAASATKTATEATKNAVVAQKATLGTIQTTLSAMYGLLASGMLRVQTQMQLSGVLGAGAGSPLDASVKDPNTGLPLWMTQAVAPPKPAPKKPARYDGGWGDAIATEMKHKPPGSDLVIANSSETIIPAKGLQVRSAWGGMNAAPMTVNTTVTINQQPGQDADALATIVAMKIGEAVADARASSLFV